MKHEWRKGVPIDISKIEDPPEYEKDERWIKLNEDFENAKKTLTKWTEF